jgi:predicted kinase
MENTMRTLLMMAGLPGAGKTTLARALGRKLGWHVVDKDAHKEVLLDGGIDEEQAGVLAYEIAFRTIHCELAEQGVSVILDTAALQRFIFDKVYEIVRGIEGTRLKIILCVADKDLRHYRIQTRPRQITTIRVNPDTITDYLFYFRHLPADILTLYTQNPFEECFEAAIKYIGSNTPSIYYPRQ